MTVPWRVRYRNAVATLAAGAVAIALSGCGLAEKLQAATSGRNCTTVGLDEGVSVDLFSVLPLEGEYRVSLSLPGTEDSIQETVSGNTEAGLFVWNAVDLDGDPIKVEVEAKDTSGAVAYRGSGTRAPALNQPNGAGCDPENYWLSLKATEAGELVPVPRFEPVLDGHGRASMWVHTVCGVRYLDDVYGGGGSYVRVDGPLDDGAGGPPPGWAVPLQRGWVSTDGDLRVFEDERGHREVFRPWQEGDYYEQCDQ